MLSRTCFLLSLCLILTSKVFASSLTVELHELNTSKNGLGKSIGTVKFQDSHYGLLIKSHLKNLTPGSHGFHLHKNPSCGPLKKKGKLIPGLAAGGHYDPYNTKKHLGPYSDKAHLGDLPVLYVDKNGTANSVTLAPRLKTSTLKNHALMIHEGGDNYSDSPKPLGGGGNRIACGIVEPSKGNRTYH